MSNDEPRDPLGPRDDPDAGGPAPEPESEPDTEGHSLLYAELHRGIAASRAKEVADWGKSEKIRRSAQEAKKRATK